MTLDEILSASAQARIATHPSGAETATLDVRPVDLLFIDSSHQRDRTIAERHAWRPRLAPGALVVFHDYDHPAFPGIAAVIEQLGLDGRLHAEMFVRRAAVAAGPGLSVLWCPAVAY